MKKIIVFSCSGVSNVGCLSHRAAAIVKNKGRFDAHKSLSRLIATHDKNHNGYSLSEYEIFALDGCECSCTAVLLEQEHLVPAHHLIITDLGIEKTETENFSDAELELVRDGIYACCADVGTDNMSFAMSKPKCACMS